MSFPYLDALDPGRKTYHAGTERTRPPARTLERLAPHLAAMGITRIANVTGLDRTGIPVVMVCRPGSRSVSVFQGKGVDLDAARASGVMEAVETYHAERIRAPLRFASLEELRRDHAVLDPATLPVSAQGCPHPGRPSLWVEGRDIVRDEPVWVPHDAVHTDYTDTSPPCASGIRVSTNGLASGNCLVEAIGHGLWEVVERDATTLWNHLDPCARQATEIDAGTVEEPVCRGLVRACRRAGLSVRAWDASPDSGVPTFVAELHEPEPGAGAAWPRPCFGSGCHPARHVALARALTEAAQARTTFIAGARDDTRRDDYESDGAPPLARRTGAPGEPPYRRFDAPTSRSSDTVREDLLWTLDRLARTGLEQVVVVDLTDHAFGLPVVRVLVPGLEGPDEHYEDYVPGPRARSLMAARSGASAAG